MNRGSHCVCHFLWPPCIADAGIIFYRFLGDRLQNGSPYAIGRLVLFLYRQHCEQRKAPVFELLRGRFEVFRPAGATRCTDCGKIWRGGRPPCQISPPPVQDKGVGPLKLKFLLRFDQNVEYKRPARFSQNLQSLYPHSGRVSC